MGTPEVEAFFRGASLDDIEKPNDEEKKYFYPAKYDPINWWDLVGEKIMDLYPIDNLSWMSPYGKAYYLPAYMLTVLPLLNGILLDHDIQSKHSDPVGFVVDVIHSLIPPENLDGMKLWEMASILPEEKRSPLNKNDLYTMSQDESFIIFLSQISNKQKVAVGEFIQYVFDTWYQSITLQEIDREEMRLLRFCWLD